MFGLIGGSVKGGETDAEEPANQCASVIIAARASEGKVIAKNAPCHFADVRVAVREQVVAARLARKDHRAALMHMKIWKGRTKHRKGFGYLTRLRNRNEKFV